MMATDDVQPPITSPAIAPTQVSRRHQMPRTSSGQKVDAAIAKAPAHQHVQVEALHLEPGHQTDRTRDDGAPPERADPAAHQVVRHRAGDADEQARRRRQKGRECSSGHKCAEHRAADAANQRVRQDQHHRVGLSGQVEARITESAEHGEHGREHDRSSPRASTR